MRFLFSDVRNDSALEAAYDDDQPAGDYRLSLMAYVEAVSALVKVAEEARRIDEEAEIGTADGAGCDVYYISEDRFARLKDALAPFNWTDA